MRSALLGVALIAVTSAGCGGGSASDEGTTPRNRASKRAYTPPADYEDENSVGMSDERVSRWRWKGARKDCFYVVGNRCFRTDQAACKAAGCSLKRCDLDDSSAPVKASCPGKKKGKKK